MSDRLYFRQLLSGRDFATDDMVARQMVNFVYLIGDRQTGEAVAVDPAYRVGDLVDVLAADGMRLVGALATHYHADHVGGSFGGHTVEGILELLETAPVPIRALVLAAVLRQELVVIAQLFRRGGPPAGPHGAAPPAQRRTAAPGR